nr:hypothetical protein WS71_26980 [Burkholderia mayonis]
MHALCARYGNAGQLLALRRCDAPSSCMPVRHYVRTNACESCNRVAEFARRRADCMESNFGGFATAICRRGSHEKKKCMLVDRMPRRRAYAAD